MADLVISSTRWPKEASMTSHKTSFRPSRPRERLEILPTKSFIMLRLKSGSTKSS